MLRRALTFAVLGLLIAGSVGSAAAKRSVTKAAGVKVVDCRTGDTAESRSATFQGRLRAVRGSERMGMRFTLLERFGDERRHVVDFPELKAWHFSKPGIKDFRYKQTVTGLQRGGDYRARVDFRWYDGDGNLLRKARRTSGLCHQGGELPNLRPGLPTAAAGPEGTAVYVVPVYNRGKADAADVAVELSVDGATTNTGHIDSIPAGQRREVRLNGPPCKAGLRVVVDPSDAVKERRERDNLLKLPCPPQR